MSQAVAPDCARLPSRKERRAESPQHRAVYRDCRIERSGRVRRSARGSPTYHVHRPESRARVPSPPPPGVGENEPGANGNVGADFVAKSPPDGHTLLLADIGALAISPSVYPTLPFDPVKDFAPVTMVAYSPHILVVHPSVPASSVHELMSLAKSKPGK